MKKSYFRSRNMNIVMTRPQRMFRWLRRIRHRCGYGIHSPFAFSFVCGVLYERGTYYAYARLDKSYRRPTSRGLRRKDCRLLFRLANYVRPEVCSLCGELPSGSWFDYLSAGSLHTRYSPLLCRAGLIVGDDAWETHADELLEAVEPGGVLLLPGIDRSAERRRVWRELLTRPQSQVSFDLGDFGIIFYRVDLQREHYLINYL